MSDPVLTLVDGKTIFVCADRSWNGRDLLDAALFRGELQPEWEDLLRSLAAERRADEQNLEVDDDAFDSAAEQFRYERDLITAEETEQWLAERGVSLEEFSAHFVRRYWAGHWDDVTAEDLDFLAATNEMRKLLTDELVLSGKLDGMAIRQSWRVAAYQEAASAGVDPGLIEEQRAQCLERCGLGAEGLAGWLEQVGRGPEWLQEALTMEAIYHRDRAALLSPRAREHEIAALRLPLTRFEVETIELDSLDAAREALLCARDDGMSMEEVATEGRYPYRHPEVLLEEIPEDLQQKFLSVHPGDILEPIARGDGFHLCRIVGKKEPDLDDPVVKARADQRILDRHFSDLSTRHIQWRTLLA